MRCVSRFSSPDFLPVCVPIFFALLQKAAEDRDPALTEMKLSWAMTPLRDDPRWIEILKMMGLPV